MPELPDVQVFREYVDATCLHQTIETVHFRDVKDLLEDVSSSTLRRHLTGGSFRRTRRHGKHLFVAVGEDGWLRMHFGMTGFIEFVQGSPEKVPDHTRLFLDFQGGGRMAYVNMRKLGSLGWLEDVEAWVEEEGLGPDALDVDAQELAGLLEGRRGTLKGTLMNQEIIAGLGNVYTDEILFRAGMHPERVAGKLGGEEVDDLHEAMRYVLQTSIDGRIEEFPPDFLIRYREEGAECPRCGGRIEKKTVSGRSTYFCPNHQGTRE